MHMCSYEVVHTVCVWESGGLRAKKKNLSLLHVSVSRLKRDMGSVSVTSSEKASSFFEQKMNALIFHTLNNTLIDTV